MRKILSNHRGSIAVPIEIERSPAINPRERVFERISTKFFQKCRENPLRKDEKLPDKNATERANTI